MESQERVELPAAFEDCDVDILVQLIADMMERMMAHNDQIPLSPASITRFHSRTAPGISVLDYLRRIVRFTKAERVCLLITLHYIDQIYVRMPVFVLSSLTCHRFVITSITVSSKCLCDAFQPNSVYAKVGGIPVAELNVLEREFVRMIDWRLTVSILSFPSLLPPTRLYLHTGMYTLRLNSYHLLLPLPVLWAVALRASPAQCTRDILQEFYVNLVQSFSKGGYVIADASSSSLSSDSDMEYEVSPTASPIPTPQPHSQVLHVLDGSTASTGLRREPSNALSDGTATLAPEAPQPPTLEQNMAFAALQQGHESGSETDMDTS